MNKSLDEVDRPLLMNAAGKTNIIHDGYNVNGNDSSVWLKDFPEYSRPLGPPQGPAKKEGYIYSREYEHASVWLDIEHEKARIQWRSGT